MAEHLDALPERVDTIERKLDALSSSVDKRFEQVDKRFDEVDKRFEEVDKRFEEVKLQFVEQRQYTEFAYERLEQRMSAGFKRLERKLDQVIDDRSRPTSRRPPRPRNKR